MESGASVASERYQIMPQVVLRLLMIAGAAVFLMPDDAFAWGAGIHVAQGSFILENLKIISPQIAAVLSANPFDYIYGCISADIFIGKGYRRRDDHCHNWSVGLKVLEDAVDDPTRAYAFGYLSHLAADIIAHNYFVPNLLYVTPASKGIGHVYWEFRADRFISRKHWKLASKVISMHNHGADTLIKKVMNRSRLRFGAKKMVFKRAVRINDIIVWKEHVEHARNGGRVTKDQVSRLNNYSINLIIDLLRKEKKSICMSYDPVGTDNTVAAKMRRRSERREMIQIDREEEMFEIPQEIIDIDYFDHKTVRL